jgi:hypothetical protein
MVKKGYVARSQLEHYRSELLNRDPASGPTGSGYKLIPDKYRFKPDFGSVPSMHKLARVMMVNARRAIAEGDLDAAEAIAGKLEEESLNFGAFEDSPAKVRAAIKAAKSKAAGANEPLETPAGQK